MSDAPEHGNATPEKDQGSGRGDEPTRPMGLGEGSGFGAGWESTSGSAGGSWPSAGAAASDRPAPGNDNGPFAPPTNPYGAAPGQQQPFPPGPPGAPGAAGAPGPYGNPQGPYGNPQGPFTSPQGPYGYPGVQPYGQVPGYGYGYAGPPQTDSGARNSLILAIVGIFICGILLGPAAIVEGVKARKRIRLSNGRLTGDGLAIAGIVIGILTLTVTAIYLVIVIIAASKSPSSRLR